LREPLAIGEAKIESGQLQFPFANLRVQQGFISTTSEDPFRPTLYATAGSRTFGYDVQMTLTGPADKPIIEFSSTPPLTSEQVLLMITAGELPRRETTFSTEQRAGRLALFLGRSLLSKFTGDDGGAERLTVTSGENVTEQGKQTYALEYKINEDVSIVGEYDRFGAWNAGVKWRVYSK
jgi:translocation and assembly module TamB